MPINLSSLNPPKAKPDGIDLSSLNTSPDLSSITGQNTPSEATQAVQTPPNTSRSTLSDIGVGVTTGVPDAILNMVQSGAQVGQWLESFAPKSLTNWRDKVEQKLGSSVNYQDIINATEKAKNTLPQTQTRAGGTVKNITEFLTGMGGEGKLLKGIGDLASTHTLANMISRGMVTGATAAFTSLDSNAQTTANLVEHYVTDPDAKKVIHTYLANHSPGPSLEGRVKNVVDNAVAGPVGELLFAGLRLGKAALMAKRQASKITKMAPAFNEVRDRLISDHGLNSEAATQRAMEVTGLNKTNFVPEPVAHEDLSKLTPDELLQKAQDMGVDTQHFVTKTGAPKIVDLLKKVEKEQPKQAYTSQPDMGKLQKVANEAAQKSPHVANTRIGKTLEQVKGEQPTILDTIAKAEETFQKTAPKSSAIKEFPSTIVDTPALREYLDNAVTKFNASVSDRTKRAAKLTRQAVENQGNKVRPDGYLRSLPAKSILGIRETVQLLNNRAGKFHGRWEAENHLRSATAHGQIDDFSRSVGKLRKSDQKELNKIWNQGGVTEVQNFVDRHPELAHGWNQVKNMLSDLGGQAKAVGGLDDAQLLSDYLPRNVRDFKGFLKASGESDRTAVTAALAEASAKAGRKLTDWERANVINKTIRNRPLQAGQVGKASHMRERQFSSVPGNLLPHYDGAVGALRHYASTMSENIGKRKLLGYTERGGDLTNPEVVASLLSKGGGSSGGIGKILQEELDKGNINSQDLQHISSLIQSRVGIGATHPSKWVQNMKNFMYLGTLINPYSVLKQSTDALMGAYVNGISNTIHGIAQAITGKGLTPEDIGLRHIAQDMMGSGSRSQVWLNKALDWSQFARLDSIGKASVINGSFREFRNLAGSVEGIDKLQKEYGAAFTPEEFQQVIKDLRGGHPSPNVKYMLFNDLAKLQPISLSEMPKMYLDHPNGRWLYALKTFTLKGLNRIYADGIDKMRRGEVHQGAKNLMLYAGLLVGSGAGIDSVNDYLQGRDQMNISDRVLANALGLIGTNDYVVHQLGKGNIQDAVISSYLPPIAPFAQGTFKDAADMWNGKAKDWNNWHVMNYVPFVGRMIHNNYVPGIGEIFPGESGATQKHNARLQQQGG